MKNRTLKKLLGWSLAAVLAAGTLAGCGSSSDGGSDTSDTEETDGAEDAAEDESDEAVETEEEAAEVTTVYVATGGTVAPFTYTDDDDNLIGYDVDLLRAIFEYLPQYELDIEATDIPSITTGLDSGLYDIGACNFSYSDERAEKYVFTDPIFENQYVIAVRSDDDSIASWNDIVGKSTEVSSGTNYATALENWNEDNPDSQVDINYSEADLASTLANVESGKYDFQLIDRTTLETYLNEYGFDLKSIELSDDESSIIASNPYAYYLLENTEEGEALAEEINEALAQVIADGTAAEISEQYLGGNYLPDSE